MKLNLQYTNRSIHKVDRYSWEDRTKKISINHEKNSLRWFHTIWRRKVFVVLLWQRYPLKGWAIRKYFVLNATKSRDFQWKYDIQFIWTPRKAGKFNGIFFFRKSSMTTRSKNSIQNQRLYIYIYIYIYIYNLWFCILFIYIYICVCLYVHVNIYIYICVCVCVFVYIHIYVYICVFNPGNGTAPCTSLW